MNRLGSNYRSSNALNADLDTIETAFDNTLSRDGSTPNAMLSDFDLNGYRVLNAPAPTVVTDIARLQEVQEYFNLLTEERGGSHLLGGYTDVALRSISDKLDDFVNILDFEGAVGDNVNDDTEAFRTAISQLNGRKLYVPAGDWVITSTIEVNPVATLDTDIALSVGAFAPGLQMEGDGMVNTRLRNRVANGPMFSFNVTTPDQLDPEDAYAFRAQQGVKISNLAVVGQSTIANSTAFKIFNAYHVQFDQVHIRNCTGTAIKLVNGEEPDDGWNMLGLTNLWIENCGTGGEGWGIDATGLTTKNEGSFTDCKHVFIQACGRNQSFSVTGVTNATPGVVTVSLNQLPTVAGVTAHPFVAGDQVQFHGSLKTATLANNPFTTTLESPIVSVAATAHGLSLGDQVSFSGATAVGGITLSGVYQISGTSTNSFYVIHSADATSAATGGGAAVVMISPMAALNFTPFYVGPSPTATTLSLYQASGSSISLGSDPIATTSGSPTVTITKTSHGLSAGNLVVLTDAEETGGLTVEKLYTIVATPTANTFTITAASNATSTATGGGDNIDVQLVTAVNTAAYGTFVAQVPAALGANPIATTSGSTTVVVTATAHGLAADHVVVIAGASGFNNIVPDGEYRITALGDTVGADTTNKFRITMSTTANATGSGGGSAATILLKSVANAAEVGYYIPQSGGMSWKGQLIELQQCGFTLNQNCAFLVPGDAGLGIGVVASQVSWENSYRRHVFSTGVTSFYAIGSQFHGNSLYRQWALAEFDSSKWAVRGVLFVNTKVRAALGCGVAFKLSGVTSVAPAMRVQNTIWDDFDYPRQKRFVGVSFDPVPNNLSLAYSSATLIALKPQTLLGTGNKVPLCLVGPVNASSTGVASTTGEWTTYEPTSSNGVSSFNTTTGQSGGPALAANTIYCMYLYDDDGTTRLKPSLLSPTLDLIHGYMVMPGDASKLYVGRAQTDGSSNWTTSGHAFLNPIALSGDVAGTPEWMWRNEADNKLYVDSASLPNTATAGVASYWPTYEYLISYDPADLAAGATRYTDFTVTSGVGDFVIGAQHSVGWGDVEVSATGKGANTVRLKEYNPTGSPINNGAGTIRFIYMKRS